jgi:hypothetical protein
VASIDEYETTTAGFAVSCHKVEIPKPPAPGVVEILMLNIIVKETAYNADGTANVKLLVQDYNGTILPDALVRISGSDIVYATGNDGTIIIRNVKEGDYTATASKKGYSEDQVNFTIKFEVKKEPAAVPEQPSVGEEAAQIFSVPYCPILIILAILVILYILWKRRKKKESVDEAQLKEPKEQNNGTNHNPLLKGKKKWQNHGANHNHNHKPAE